MAANNNTASVVDSRNDIPLDTATINHHHHHHHHHHFFNNTLTKCNNEQNIRKLITVFKK